MKPSRWLIVSMLSVSGLVILSAAGRWWVTWPERTAREFVGLLKAHKTEQALRMMPVGSEISVLGHRWEFAADGEQMPTRTWLDYIAGRYEFELGIVHELRPGWWGSIVHQQEFVAKRGHIEHKPLDLRLPEGE